MSVYREVPGNVCTKGKTEGALGPLRVGFSCCPYVLGVWAVMLCCPMTLVSRVSAGSSDWTGMGAIPWGPDSSGL